MTIDALALGVSGFAKFNNFGATNFISTSINLGAFASIVITQGPFTSREPTKKKIEANINRVFKEEWVAQFP